MKADVSDSQCSEFLKRIHEKNRLRYEERLREKLDCEDDFSS